MDREPPKDAETEPERGLGVGQVAFGAVAQLATRTSDNLVSAYRLSDPALSELPLERLLDELLGRVRDILQVDTVAVLLLDESGQLLARAAKGIEEEVEQGVRIPFGRGFAGRIAAKREAIFIADVDHSDVLNPLLRAKGIRSLLGVPLISAGTLLGVLHVGTLTRREFTESDAALLALAAARVAPAIERAQLFEELERQQGTTLALQRSLLPDVLPQVLGVDVAARYLPAADDVGGDWFDVLELGDGRVAVVIGDVAGHGLRAAALMGQLRTGLRAYVLEGHTPGEALRLLDRLLQTLRSRGMATVTCAIMDLADGAVTIATAGHPPAFVLSADGRARSLEPPRAPPLGTMQHPTYPEGGTTLAPGDALLLYTDGLIERRDTPLNAAVERLRATLETARGGSAEQICLRLLDELLPAETPSFDDVALLVMRRQALGAVVRLHLATDPRVLSGTRHLVSRWLRERGAGEDEIRAIVLACGEACANAIEHAYAPGRAGFDLELAHDDDGVVSVTVRDRGTWREPRGTNRGRGLAMIERLTDEVEVRREPGGNEVVMRRRLRG